MVSDRNRLSSLLVLSGLLLGSSGASAQQSPKKALPPATEPEAMTVEVGAFGGLFLPSDRHELYDADSVPHRGLGSPAAELGLRAAFFPLRFFGAEVEGALIPLSIDGGGSGTGYSVRGHLMAQYPWRISPFAVVGAGALAISSGSDELGDDVDGAFHWGVGAKAYLTDLFSVRLDGRHVVSAALDEADAATGRREDGITSHFELLLGVGLTFPRAKREPPDPDNDGFVGVADKCPTEKGVAPDGCPRRDTDGDGFMDDDDTCPDVPGLAPDGCPPRDADQDGVPDGSDACPDLPGSRSTGGCPDRDGDGIADVEDSCPDTSGIPPHGCPADDPDGDGVVGDSDGCPTVAGSAPSGCPDGDGDGVPDGRDACPTELETVNGYEDEDGCPDEIPAEVKRFTGTIEGIRFASGNAVIRPGSFATLNAVVKVLNDYPALRLEIDGHTDDTGDRERNLKLSEARAQAVKNYLVKKGIEESRLVAIGFGPDRPLDTNKTASGRARNRRIEFKLIQ